MRARQAKIDRCMAEGICHICDKPVNDGDAVYSITGAHYDCHDQLVAKGDQALKNMEKAIDRLKRKLK